MYQKAVEDGKEMSRCPSQFRKTIEVDERSVVRVRDLLGHKAVLSMKIADADDLEVMEPKRGAIIEQ